MKLQGKFLLGTALIVTLSVTLVGLLTILSERRILTRLTHERGQKLATQLARVAQESLLQNELILFNYMKNLRTETGFWAAYYADKAGRIQVHSNPEQIGSIPDSSTVIDHSAPVFFGSANAGTAHVVFSRDEIDRLIAASTKQTIRRILVLSVIALFTGLAAALIFSRTMIKPIHHIVQGMHQLKEGRLDPLSVLDRNDELGWLSSELNLTTKKLKELDDLKREFTAAVTHELRSPLTAINQYLSSLLSGNYGPLTADQNEAVLVISNNSIRLKSFVDDVLTTAKIDAGKTELFLEIFDIRCPIKEAHKLFKEMAAAKKLPFAADLSDTPLWVRADRGMVQRVISNLISNALKFTEKGSVTIECKKTPDGVVTTISDTGIGIAPDDREKIFEKFAQLAQSDQTPKGTGLGLYIVKSFIDLHQGRIAVEAHPGGGTRISFSLPSSSPP